MKGVTILSESVSSDLVSNIILLIFFVVCFLFMIYVIYLGCIVGDGLIHLIWEVPLTLIFLYVCVLLVGVIPYPTYTTTYKVTIEDSVGFKDFNEKYILLYQDGEIYTVEERK